MRKKPKASHHAEPPENIRACLTCKRVRCGGMRDCMLKRKQEMLKNEETQK